MNVSGNAAQGILLADCNDSDISYDVALKCLNEAIDHHDQQALVSFFSNYPDFDFRKTLAEHHPPLSLAVQVCSEKFLRKLLTQADLFPELLSSTAYVEHSLLAIACESREPSIVALLLEIGADPNDGGIGTLKNLLIWLACENRVQMMALLCEAGVNKEAEDVQGFTALMHAILRGHSEVVTYLLEHGALVDAPMHKGLAVALAVAEENVEVLKILISFKADVNVMGSTTKLTPLMRAIGARRSAEMIDVLLAAGATVSAKDGRGYSAFMMAAELNDVNALQRLVQHATVDVETKAFHQRQSAEMQGNPGMQLIAFRQRFGLDYWNYCYSETALMIAARFGRLGAVNALLDLGAYVNARNDQGYTALMLAARFDRPEIITALCARGANMSLSIGEGFTALGIAIYRASEAVVSALISAGANVHQKIDHIDSTPLMLAVRQGGNHLLSLLVDAGAHLEAEDRVGCTALAIAVEAQDLDDVQTLLGLGACPRGGVSGKVLPLVIAAEKDNDVMVSLLLGSGAAINARDRHGMTALMSAAQHRSKKVFMCLIQAGADPSLSSDAGMNAKEYAEVAMFYSAVNLLTARGGDGFISKRKKWC